MVRQGFSARPVRMNPSGPGSAARVVSVLAIVCIVASGCASDEGGVTYSIGESFLPGLLETN